MQDTDMYLLKFSHEAAWLESYPASFIDPGLAAPEVGYGNVISCPHPLKAAALYCRCQALPTVLLSLSLGRK